MSRRIAMYWAYRLRKAGLRVLVTRVNWNGRDRFDDMNWAVSLANPDTTSSAIYRRGWHSTWVGCRYRHDDWHSPGKIHYGDSVRDGDCLVGLERWVLLGRIATLLHREQLRRAIRAGEIRRAYEKAR